MHRTDKFWQHSSIIWPVWLNGWVIGYQLSGFRVETRCSLLNFRLNACFEQEVSWNSGNYRVWIHSKTRTWHDKNIQSNAPHKYVLTTQLSHLGSLPKWSSVCLRTKWSWLRVPLQSLKLYILALFWTRRFFKFRQLHSVDSLWNTYVIR